MEIEGRSLHERVVQAAIVFALLLGFDLYRGSVDAVEITAAAVSFFVLLIALDGVRIRLLDR